MTHDNYAHIHDPDPPLLWSSSGDGLCEYLSQPYLEYIGMYHEQAAGDGWWSILHQGDRPAVREAWLNAHKTGSLYLVNARHRRYDGSYDWFRVHAVAVRDQTGKIVRWIGSNVNLGDEARQSRAIQAWHRRQAILLAGQLPEDIGDQRLILQAATELLDTFVDKAPRGPTMPIPQAGNVLSFPAR